VSYAREVVARKRKAQSAPGLQQNSASTVEVTLPGLTDPFLDFPLPEVRRGPMGFFIAVADFIQFVTSEMTEFGLDDWIGMITA
jgi:hypothetical protein